MVLRPEPVADALDALRRPDSTVILLDAGGRAVRPGPRRATWPRGRHLVLVCPRYEGIDERVRDLVDLELSIGDYVLTGGELRGARVIDAVLAAAARGHRRRLDGRGVVQRRAPRVPAVHAAGRVPRARRAGRPRERRPRGGPALASRRRRSSGPGTRRPDLLPAARR